MTDSRNALSSQSEDLASLGLVDCEPPEAFDAITRLALRLFGVPVALISIIEEERDRQFFTSQQGLPEPWCGMRQTPLSHSFCQHVKSSGRPLIVRDAPKDPLVCDNMAIEDLNVVAYLGVPISKPDGTVLGALCVIQDTERAWTEGDLKTLIDLARCVNDEIHLRVAMQTTERLHRELADAHKRTRVYTATRESIAQAFMAPDLSLRQRFQALLQAGCNALGTDAAVIARVDGGMPIILFGHVPGSHPNMRLSTEVSGTLAGHVLSGEAHLCLRDVSQSRWSGLPTLLGGVPGSYAGTPLVFDGVLFGVLEFMSAEPRVEDWSEEEISILSIISMFTCANLAVFQQIQTLERSETELLPKPGAATARVISIAD